MSLSLTKGLTSHRTGSGRCACSFLNELSRLRLGFRHRRACILGKSADVYRGDLRFYFVRLVPLGGLRSHLAGPGSRPSWEGETVPIR
jgi:hypothetical protein